LFSSSTRRRGFVPGSAAGGWRQLVENSKGNARTASHAPARRDMAAVVPPARISCQTAPTWREYPRPAVSRHLGVERSSVSPSALRPA
jgi:hypothetical protein